MRSELGVLVIVAKIFDYWLLPAGIISAGDYKTFMKYQASNV